MTITRVIVRQVSDRRTLERRQGERRGQWLGPPYGYERRHNADYRVGPRRLGQDRRCVQG